MQDCLSWEGSPDALLANCDFVQGNFLPQFPAPPEPRASTGQQSSFLPGGQRLGAALREHAACVPCPSVAESPRGGGGERRRRGGGPTTAGGMAANRAPGIGGRGGGTNPKLLG